MLNIFDSSIKNRSDFILQKRILLDFLEKWDYNMKHKI